MPRPLQATVDMGAFEVPTPDPGSGDRYVAPGGGNQFPFTNWAMAAHVLQDAVALAQAVHGDGLHHVDGGLDVIEVRHGGRRDDGGERSERGTDERGEAVVLEGEAHEGQRAAHPNLGTMTRSTTM
jgi:hypothetical protein